MPAAAVIPAPIAYTKVVAVKKLVVEFGLQFAIFYWFYTSRRCANGAHRVILNLILILL